MVRRIKRWWDARSPAFDIWLDPGSISLGETNKWEGGVLMCYYESDPMFDGDLTFWHKNGQKFIKGFVTQGKNEGLQTIWHENGQKSREVNYKDGEFISAKYWNTKGELKK